MSLAVDNPILNNPFEEPKEYWIYDEGQPKKMSGRRPAGYYFRTGKRADTQVALFVEEQFKELELINKIRQRVKEWRDGGYKGGTGVTERLLQHWNLPDRERKLFFCQVEAVETIIYLTEIMPKNPKGITIPPDLPAESDLAKGYKPLKRYGCKMATGSGKTLVMAMLAAWSVINKAQYRQDKRFSDAVLVVCPNLTVKERLSVLYPSNPENYYEKFDLVPRSMLDMLSKGKFFITNWHSFLPVDDSKKRSVIQRGEESERAFCNRTLKELSGKENILVFNDEAHHAYRPAPFENEEELKKLSGEERKNLKEEKEEATIWIGGLDKINFARKINLCVDLSATPFYIQGSGYPEGSPLPWLVSDFGLVDAIESGIVKIPRVPVDDNSGQPIPKYFHLWRTINESLPGAEKATQRRKPKPESVFREAEGALTMLAGEWKKTFKDFERDDFPVPPVMICVCDNTDLAELIFEYISGEKKVEKQRIFTAGKLFPDLLGNSESFQPSMRIDTKLLGEAESEDGTQTKQEVAQGLRLRVATVGKTEWQGQGDPPGKDVRCVVSVGMLTEGWDANNVTQIFGLRAFTSQLLCEQVVGRGLRRMNYTLDETGMLPEEYVDVYGIPFEVIPVKKKGKGPTPPPPPSTLVQALKDRVHLKIEFPRVEGFVFDVKSRIKIDMSKLKEITVDPSKEPTKVVVKGAVGYKIGFPTRLGPGKEAYQDRNPFHETRRLKEIIFEIARRITNSLKDREKFQWQAREILFPQVLSIVKRFIEEKVRFIDAKPNEIALEKYIQLIVERLLAAIEPAVDEGEAPLLPIIERFRPKGSTSEVLFRTVRRAHPTLKSHVSHVVTDNRSWEHTVSFYLEDNPNVVSYVKNDHLDFSIPYDFLGVRHYYYPDFLIRCSTDSGESTVILEVKGYESEQDRQKRTATERWVKAVNYHSGYGKWQLIECRDPRTVDKLLNGLFR
ncbi:MAG: DEAD/DEAH box helicase family protein [Nitrospirae bacterium]|nr:DEAD/DEAH box helicase family protein [Nitrospirota bacterium]MCL5422698.1 DEAD/DEAH box helicase family protein [Nitrospirota bacterium]